MAEVMKISLIKLPQIDGLALTSSDDILKSMLDQSKDKESLIKQLLTTRLGNDEADRIAKNC